MANRPFLLIKNYFLLSGGEFISKVITFVAIAFLARRLGPGGYGYVEYASAVLLCAGLIVDQGFGMYGAREIAREHAKTDNLVSEVVIVRLILAILTYLGVALFALALSPSPTQSKLLLIFNLSLFGLPFLILWVFQGHNQMGPVSIAQILRQTTYAAVIFLFVRTISQIWMVGLAEIAGVWVAALFSIVFYVYQFHPKILTRPVFTRQLFREGIPIGLSQIFWTARIFGATVIVGLFAAPADVGYFGGAMRVMVALHTFIFLYFYNLLPAISRDWIAHDGTFSRLITNSLYLVIWVGVLLGIPAIIIAPTVITIIYGALFAPAGVILQWMIIVLLIAGLDGHYRFGLIAANYQKAEMIVSALGAILGVVLISVGYFLGGVYGSAVALIFVELFVWISTWWYSRSKLDLTGHAAILARPLMATLLTLGLIWILPFTSNLLNSMTAFFTIALLAILIDVKVRDELGNFVRIVGSRL
jgi:O-antigen/teichoic acid export membrane protein